MKRGKNNRRAQAGIISIILLILIVIILMTIIANIVIPLIRQGSEQITIVPFTSYFVIQDVKQWADNGLAIEVMHESGEAMPDNLQFIFYNVDGSNTIVTQNQNIPPQLETKTFNFNATDLPANRTITKVSVVPLFGKTSGTESTFHVQSFKFFNSCSDILRNGKTNGNGFYIIDADPQAGMPPFNVYCDMTTDGGGWTLVWSNLRGDPEGIIRGVARNKPTTNITWDTAINTPPRYSGSIGTDLEKFNAYLGLKWWESQGEILRYDWANNYSSPIDQRFYSEYNFKKINSTSGQEMYLINVSTNNYVFKIGTTPASLVTYHNFYPFSTIDRENSGNNCATSNGGAPFWYRAGTCQLGSIAGVGETASINGAYWANTIPSSWGTDNGAGAGNGWMYIRKK